MRGVVPRLARIRYSGFDLEGRPIERSAEGFHARVVQHECDHLIGKLYPMRIRDFSRFGFAERAVSGPRSGRRRMKRHRDCRASADLGVKERVGVAGTSASGDRRTLKQGCMPFAGCTRRVRSFREFAE